MSKAVDTASLPAAEAKKVEALAAQFPPQPPPPASNPQARDAFAYDITIDGRTYHADDSTLPDRWRELVDWLTGQA